jgi:hypothetical protein
MIYYSTILLMNLIFLFLFKFAVGNDMENLTDLYICVCVYSLILYLIG